MKNILIFSTCTKLRTLSKQGLRAGGPESQEDPFIDRSFPARSKGRNGGFRYRIEHSKTAQKGNVFYPVQK